jgi:hypothetical protein
MNTKQITVPILCLFLLNFTGVVHGTETILDDTPVLSGDDFYKEYSFELPAGDTITIHIEVVYGDGAIDFFIKNETDTLYSKLSILTLDDVWTVPAEDHYVFDLELNDGWSTVHIVLGSEIIPEFPTWTSMLLILIVLTVSMIVYKRKLLKTLIH